MNTHTVSLVTHPIPPVWNAESRILLLGTMPSPASRSAGFFYMHPQNRFWKVVSGILGEELPTTVPEKKAMLLAHRIALWDVIQSCDITGSSDSSIRNVVPNDLREILDHSQVERIFVNGKTAEKYYIKYTEPVLGRKAICLPSTSPANAAWGIDRLIEEWRQIK